MSITSISNQTGFSLGENKGTAKSGGGEADLFASLIDKLKEEMKKTPMERAKDRVLEKRGLSKEQYDALPPKERAAVDAEIAEETRKATEQAQAERKKRMIW